MNDQGEVPAPAEAKGDGMCYCQEGAMCPACERRLAADAQTQQEAQCVWSNPAANDIVERLRALSRYEHSDLSVGDEAAAEIVRLRGAFAKVKEVMLSRIKWTPCDCGCPTGRKPDGPHSVTWLRAVQQVDIALSELNPEDRK